MRTRRAAMQRERVAEQVAVFKGALLVTFGFVVSMATAVVGLLVSF